MHDKTSYTLRYFLLLSLKEKTWKKLEILFSDELLVYLFIKQESYKFQLFPNKKQLYSEKHF